MIVPVGDLNFFFFQPFLLLFLNLFSMVSSVWINLSQKGRNGNMLIFLVVSPQVDFYSLNVANLLAFGSPYVTAQHFFFVQFIF